MKLTACVALTLTSLVAARPSLGSLRHRYSSVDGPGDGSTCMTNCSACASGSNVTDPQSSLTLLPYLVVDVATNGTSNNTGATPSLVSKDNFINYCATVGLPLLDGTQNQKSTGMCNPVVMGAIPSVSHLPSSKFVSPTNLGILAVNTTFTVSLAVKGLETGWAANGDTNFLTAPQQLNMTSGLIKGHAHIVIEQLESLQQTTPTNPEKFAFFAALGGKADEKGQLHTNVTGGLPVGVYRVTSTITAMNHQPVIGPVAERGSLDDTIYVIVYAQNTTGSFEVNLGGTETTLSAAPTPTSSDGIPSGSGTPSHPSSTPPPQISPAPGTSAPYDSTPTPSAPLSTPTPVDDGTDCEDEPGLTSAPSSTPSTTPNDDGLDCGEESYPPSTPSGTPAPQPSQPTGTASVPSPTATSEEFDCGDETPTPSYPNPSAASSPTPASGTGYAI